jgi:sarcosine oxidase, subunit beta
MPHRTADVLIVGAGAFGLSCAWWMSKRCDGSRILVVDEGEFAGGASGRNGAGFRMQWGLELNIRLCQESIRFFETAAEELDYPPGIGLKQDGYLVLAHSEKALKTLEAAVGTQHRFGVPSEILDPDECIKMVPPLGRERLRGGSFCGLDGSASPFLWLDALLRACRRQGVEVVYGVRARSIEPVEAGYRVHLDDGPVGVAKVLICTDWAAPELLAPLGIDVRTEPLPKEILVTTPIPPAVKPILVSLEHKIAVNQVDRGSVIFTVSRARTGTSTRSTSDFLGFAAPKIVDLVPGLAHVPALRAWGGISSVTPDMQPILGETERDGIFVAVSSYRGFMTSPAVGRIMAAMVLDGDTNDPIASALHPRRFAAGETIIEPLLNQE